MGSAFTAEASVDPEDLRAVARRWWVLAVIGAVTAVLGVVVLLRPSDALFVVAVLIGAGFVLSGIGDIVVAGRWPRPWVPFVWGLISLGAGIVAIAWPGITLEVLAAVIGILLILRGVIAAMGALADKPTAWGLWLVIGLVEVVVGVAAIAWPDITLLVVAIIIGIDLLIAGLIELVIAFQLRALR